MVHVREGVPGAVYIGRPTKWGNPFVIGRDGDHAEVIRKYRAYLKRNVVLRAQAQTELRDKVLACFCAPLACHGDVLAEVANEPWDMPVVRALEAIE